jgi:pimeloyl-ACP methyl ester carboxylesterase
MWSPGVERGGLAFVEVELVVFDEQANGAVEHVQPLVSLVAVKAGLAEVGRDVDAVDARAGGPLRADWLPDLAVTARGRIGGAMSCWVRREKVFDRDLHRACELLCVRQRQPSGAGLESTHGRSRNSTAASERADRQTALKPGLLQSRAYPFVQVGCHTAMLPFWQRSCPARPTSDNLRGMSLLELDDARDHQLAVPGGQICAVELGDGPLVLLVHGFPEGRWSWRHQLPALARAGFHAVAIDVRGYGGSSRPAGVEAYRIVAHVADAVAVVHALGADTAVVIGHDWGSPIASACALMRPDIFTGVGLLGVPYTPRGETRPTEAFALAGGEEEFYVSYFQRPGRAEAEIEADIRGWLRGFYVALDGQSPAAPPWFTIPSGGTLRDRLPVNAPLPHWLSEAELDARAAEFERNGVAGPLNRYRNVDRDWEDLAAFDGATIRQPAIFIAGARDASTAWLSDAIDDQADWLLALAGAHLLDGGHWVQQELPDQVNSLILDWLQHARRNLD